MEFIATAEAPEPDTRVATLANGVRVVTNREPQKATANVSVFVRSGSQHESSRQSGISHMVEHMAFKGTHERDCQRINLDAERLGAEVNAHTDKDHTAFHIGGLARHAELFVRMLGDIVLNSTFPAAELEREREVILHEYADDEDDPLTIGYRLFDKCCYGDHALAQPVIGTRRNIERFTRAELLEHVQQRYSGANLIVGVAGNVDPERVESAAAAAFGMMQPGSENRVAAPDYIGGISARHQSWNSQTHVVLGFPIPGLTQAFHASVVAATLFGDGMSSPLMDQLRERRGLVYYASCSADVMELGGQFVIEASTAPERVDEFFVELTRLFAAHARGVDPVGLERARNQLAVRHLRAQEQPSRRLEAAAQDLFVHGRVRSGAEWTDAIDAVSADDVRLAFQRLLAAPPAVALVGKLGQRASRRVLDLLAARRG